jgi:hypothetical protein
MYLIVDKGNNRSNYRTTTTAFTLANEPRVGSSVEIGSLQQQELAMTNSVVFQ